MAADAATSLKLAWRQMGVARSSCFHKSEQAVRASLLSHALCQNNPHVSSAHASSVFFHLRLFGDRRRGGSMGNGGSNPAAPSGPGRSQQNLSSTARPLCFSLRQECATCVTHHPPDDKWSMFTISQDSFFFFFKGREMWKCFGASF